MFLIALGCTILLAYFVLLRRITPEEHQSRVTPFVSVVSVFLIGLGAWTGAMFYADPGYLYQVRTITGEVIGYNEPGWKYKGFGNEYPWKKAMSVANTTASENGEESTSSTLPPQSIRMLDRVDGLIQQTTRFRLPDDVTTFLAMAEEYRTPDNLLRTELVPTVQQVITASSSLMSAEDYFNGKRNDFQMDFDYQMREGIFLVDRQEFISTSKVHRNATADASKGVDQEEYGEQQQTRFNVLKLTNADGTYKTRAHNYKNFGISVVDAKITDFEPNDAFKRRMEQQQQASADRSIAREQRIQEEEQKQLAIVRGEREIAEEQAAVKKSQIKHTTEAETTKSLALISATQAKEQAFIQKEAAAIQLERDRLVAESKTVLADADKYEREARIKGDNALEQKLAAEVQIQQVWAEAFAKRNVPSTVFVSGGDNNGTVPTGSNTELQNMVQLMTMQMAKQLDYDRATTVK
jgi:regulator of protease activity HflC (stomatin/prohibitin superfamily)